MNESNYQGRVPELEKLPVEIEPPAALEESVVGVLKREGLIGATRSRGRSPWFLLAACLVATVLGWTARGLVSSAGSNRAAAPGQFLILLAEPEPLQTSKSMEELVSEYSAWAGKLAAENRLVAAGHLVGDGSRLPAGDGGAAGSTARLSLDSLSGFFLVRADSLEQATAIAASSPHVGYGGKIVVRPSEGPES